MKKTLIALMALAGVAMAADTVDQTITFTSNKTYPDTNGSPHDGVVFNLGSVTSTTTTVSTTDPIPGLLALDSITIQVRNNNGNVSQSDFLLYVMDQSSNKVVATSTNTIRPNTPAQGQKLTFNFDGDVLSTSTTYYTRFVPENSVDVAITDGVYDTSKYWSIQLAAIGVTADGSTDAWGHTQNANTTKTYTNYMPWMEISTHSIPTTPEPATATLSLLALAGLAARRRRH